MFLYWGKTQKPTESTHRNGLQITYRRSYDTSYECEKITKGQRAQIRGYFSLVGSHSTLSTT
jgi:hypothetical protein